MDSLPPDDVAPDEYQLRRKVMSLRRQVYTNPEPGGSPAVLQNLIAAEAALSRLAAERRRQPAAGAAGVLLKIEPAAPSGDVRLGARTTGLDVQVLQRMSHVPTGIAHLLDGRDRPLVTFSVTNRGRVTVRVRLASYVEYYSAQAVSTVEIEPNRCVEVHHLPTFFPERIRAVDELTRATLHVQIDNLDGATEQHNTFPIWLLARSTAYYSICDPVTNTWLDLSRYLGAWVTPNAPCVMQILRAAAGLHPRRRISGYYDTDADVTEQVRAVFNALKDEKIVYVNSLLSFGADEQERAQRVRLPRESLTHRSANCIDGTVLVASVLEAASLNPGLVIVPGHALVAWQKSENDEGWDYLETTMIDSHDFEAACQRGHELVNHYCDLLKQSGDPGSFRLLSLAELRFRHGITPME